MSTGVLFYLPQARQLSVAGALLPGWYAQFFITDTDTPTPVYSDGDLSSPLGVEVEADSAGVMEPVYLNPAVVYRVKIFRADDTLVVDVDPFDVSRGEGGTGIESIVEGTGIEVDATDPANPIVSATSTGPVHEFVEFGSDGTLYKWDNAIDVDVAAGGITGAYVVNFPADTFAKFPVVTASLASLDETAATTQLVRIGTTGADFVEVIVTNLAGARQALSGSTVMLHAWEPANWLPAG